MLAGCAVIRPRRAALLVPVSARELPALADDAEPGSFRQAVERTLPAYERTQDVARVAAARRLLEILDTIPDPRARRAAVAEEFRVVRVRDPLLLTAYYEPEIAGSLRHDARHGYPLYGRPPDLVDVEPSELDASCRCRRLAGRLRAGRLEPYPTRAEIENGSLSGRGLEVAWAADPVDLAVLQVQGSGRLRLPGGRVVGVRYAGTNGRPYRSLGKTLIDRGLLGRQGATLANIRRALAALPPAERTSVLQANERYTFFRVGDGEPVGSLGVPLTAGRSVATDPRLVPPGALGYLAARSVSRFVVAQDTGAAIVGAHADLFLGAGAEAEERAGRTNERGALYLLLPR